jgi:Tfp pilus assembly protein FimV
MSSDPTKDLKQAALAKINQEETWLTANKAWLIAVVVALVAGFILGKI